MVHVAMVYAVFLLRYGPWKFQHSQKICCFYVIHAVAYNSTVHQARVMRFTVFDSQCSRLQNALIHLSTCSLRVEVQVRKFPNCQIRSQAADTKTLTISF